MYDTISNKSLSVNSYLSCKAIQDDLFSFSYFAWFLFDKGYKPILKPHTLTRMNKFYEFLMICNAFILLSMHEMELMQLKMVYSFIIQ